MSPTQPYLIGIAVYDGVDLLDVSVPYELFNWMAQLEPGINPAAPAREVRLVSLDGASVKTRDKLTLGGDLPGLCVDDVFDLLWIPGGDPDRLQTLMRDQATMQLLWQAGSSTQYTATVCEGALLAAAAGLLDGYNATTHWAFIACLKLFPAINVAPEWPRYVIDRNRISGGGISSGLDEALALIALIAGDTVARNVQLMVQYNPKPPFNDGDPSVARPPIYTPGEDSSCDITGMAATIASVLAGGQGDIALVCGKV
ncbi:Isonitrile hydratase [Andreprevotia sp. IGB-42]|uniref:DJ-1/PfpI family protein n=1 Tax=Andreprevotia sp. IGB-42 TaxID=2497473 RepID=UPI00135B43FA|nr:DJ-1/PfpI family protein [Andreprevotia sp. IGB-42]KAF0812254.1 Isonitrile hydratase [Andreprevotia sp. IGB-42]